MGLSGCCCCVKYLLIFINILFWTAGIAAFVLFGRLVTDPTFLISLTQDENHYYIGLYIFVVVAALTLIIAFLGCCGALKESQCMLTTFFCFLLLVLVAEIATGVWAYHNRAKLDSMVRSSVKYTIQHEYGQTESKTQAFDTFQSHFGCCGANGPNDWTSTKFNANAPGLNVQVTSPSRVFNIPASCCKPDISAAQCDKARKIDVGVTKVPETAELYNKGCMDKLLKAVDDNILTVVAVIVGIVSVELFALIISICLCCNINSKEDHYKS
jgi:CD81 antigen